MKDTVTPAVKRSANSKLSKKRRGSSDRVRKMLLYQEYLTFCLKRELGLEKQVDEKERMMKWFAYEHLPATLQEISEPFGRLAESMCDRIDSGPERTVMLRKLLEAKDAAVRAKLRPGG